ncbi:vWA domain-containing protein [Pseudomonas chlororaphis]|uniref:vWA domain-containing protein n=1 Tax=Pseudomonas chlororaphis TaxID=587753 RepID=UPI00050D3881|nr:tetratricopeptide repeat protein [Pseudomonas chlororaphis]AIS13245.1 membrane protein [Pseudomonas chlororaphis subsp. aurantiaca]AZD54600.1 BatB [Pseudomonas chlororaphis subsp. aurantiaca]AZD73126.1 BatB [Pseudomonas chlororaphis subsp. aurantiaca]BBN54769.1 membrane protein [Pseudomonas chlororaphis subsp. aurantiaca]
MSAPFWAELWPHWFRPWWLLLLPLLGWLLWQLWHRQKRAGRWQMILPPAFHAALLSGGNGRESKLPWVALGLAWILAVLALLGPGWQRVEQTSQKPADPLVVLLELTPEMLAGDVPPNRLEQARRKLLDLLQVRSDAQTAIVVYAGSAHTLVPLSDDLATSRNLLEALKPSIMPQPGHRADLALLKALKLLDQGALGQGRILLIGSSLSEQERQGIRQALGGQAPQLLMLGVGSRQGSPVAQEDGSFLKDEQGAILMSRLDSPSLKRFIGEVGGRYRPARLDDNDLRGLGLLSGPQNLRSDGQTLRLDTWADQGYWLLLPLLLLAACAGRRGWLFCLPLLLFAVPQPSYAFEFNDLWLRPDQQGQRLLEQKRPGEAAQHFEDPQWQGVALYEAGNYAAAAQRFAEGNDARAHYNRGNALAKSGELEAALDAYEQALELQPELSAAQKNKALVERLLQEAEPAPPEEPAKGESQDNDETHQPPQAGAATQAPVTPGQQPPENSHPTTADESTDDEVATPGNDAIPGSELGDEQTTTPPLRDAQDNFDGEHRQALEQWLRQIPDDPGELLRRKFWYEQQQHQDQGKIR